MDNRGFTLLEVILVIFIMGILGTVLVPNMVKTKKVAESKVEDVNIQVLKSAAYLYLLDKPENEVKDEQIKIEDLKEYLEDDISGLEGYRVLYTNKKIEVKGPPKSND